MKIVGNTASIKQGSNRLISTTFADWSAIRDGTFIKFKDDYHFYTASHVEKKTYLKDFIVLRPDTIQVNEDCGVNLNEEDTLNLSYKEYELNTIYKIISSGKGFRLGDVLTLEGGTASINIVDNTLNSSIITITQVGAGGEILSVEIKNRGKYISPPPEITNLQGGYGSGASVRQSFKLADHRSFIERDIQKLEFKSAETIIQLSYSLPDGIKEGKLSTEKWEIVLTTNYTGESKTKESFQVIRDFTPNYKIPLIAPNSQNQELLFNNAITMLDRKIAQLEAEIKKIKG